MRIGALASTVAKGLLAGAAGTAAMTASTMIEMRVRDREASTAPADAAEKVLGLDPDTEEQEEMLSNAVHWSYGTGWGVPRALLGLLGLGGLAATALHFGAVWGAALVSLPALKVAPPPTKWGKEELAIDAFHHMVYAVATGLFFERIRGR